MPFMFDTFDTPQPEMPMLNELTSRNIPPMYVTEETSLNLK